MVEPGKVQGCVLVILIFLLTRSQMDSMFKEGDTNCILCHALLTHSSILGLFYAAQRGTKVWRPLFHPSSTAYELFDLGQLPLQPSLSSI